MNRSLEAHVPIIGSGIAEMIMPVIQAAAISENHEKKPETLALLKEWTTETSLASGWAKTIFLEAEKTSK